MVCLSLICEAILLSGNIQKYSHTAFKILLISVRMTAEVVTALSKVKIGFCAQRKEDSLSIFDETLGETFFGMG